MVQGLMKTVVVYLVVQYLHNLFMHGWMCGDQAAGVRPGNFPAG